MRYSLHRSIFGALAAAALLALPASPALAEYLSIAEHPVPMPEVGDVLSQGAAHSPSTTVSEAERPMSDQRFLLVALARSRHLAVPTVHWVAQAEIVEHSAADEAIPCTITPREGFYEFAWGRTSKPVVVGGSEFQSMVPPIGFLAENPAYFLTMWHSLSGIDFLYDPELLRSLSSFACCMNLDFDPQLGYGDYFASKVPCPEKLISEETVTTAEFMSWLAAHVGGSAWQENGRWVIGPFRRGEASLAVVKKLIETVKENPYPFQYWHPERFALSRIGVGALPELLAEYRAEATRRESTTDVSYLTWALATILARINSPERDRLFLDELEQSGTVWLKGQWMCDDTVAAMVLALAQSGCREVLPLIRRFLELSPRDANCRVALNLLGESPPAAPAREVVRFRGPAKHCLTEGRVQEALPVFYAALDQCFPYVGRPAKAKKIEVTPSGVVVFTGSLPHGFYWNIAVGKPKDGFVYVDAGYQRAPLWGEGFEGKAAFRDGRWLFIRWTQIWIS